MLTGQDLLRLAKASPEKTESELAREAGYVRTNQDGKECLLLKAFNKALLEAQGIVFKTARARGKEAGYETTVHQSGIVLVGKTYVQKFGLEPGDKLKIEIEDDAIVLVRAGADA